MLDLPAAYFHFANGQPFDLPELTSQFAKRQLIRFACSISSILLKDHLFNLKNWAYGLLNDAFRLKNHAFRCSEAVQPTFILQLAASDICPKGHYFHTKDQHFHTKDQHCRVEN
ncbi:hypothetical protein EDM54_21400 [Brevibacillus borstelensis]|nr:hypothetical protein EDM54_21400 [Brevibacillus borstelensis]